MSKLDHFKPKGTKVTLPNGAEVEVFPLTLGNRIDLFEAVGDIFKHFSSVNEVGTIDIDFSKIVTTVAKKSETILPASLHMTFDEIKDVITIEDEVVLIEAVAEVNKLKQLVKKILDAVNRQKETQK